MTIETSDDASPRSARVVAHHRDRYVVHLPTGDANAHLPGRLRHSISSAEELPAVGDWVTVTVHAGDPPVATIQGVLPRRSAFRRKTAGDVTAAQVVAANVDVAFIAGALPDDVNLRRIERYLTLAWESGATPVVLLTKADLVDDANASIRDVRSVAPGVEVIAISAIDGTGVDAVAAMLGPGVTAVLLGSSGVGKSTLVNALLGEERQRVGEVRNDGRGRHTTTHRELIELPGGASLIDTPGMRELQLWSAADGIEETFRDIALLAEECRFRDCAHVTEPGCAVIAALEHGALDPARLESWRALHRELAYLERRQDAAALAAAKAYAKSMQHALRDRLRDKYK
jgi:ribosome biogenesis GTPase / thiamine phosphate phosphatase